MYSIFKFHDMGKHNLDRKPYQVYAKKKLGLDLAAGSIEKVVEGEVEWISCQ
jgi:hypothetical protein